MKHNHLLLALLIPVLLTGCSSDLLATKPEPKPKKVVAKKAEKKHAAKPSKPTDNPTTTYAIDDGKNDFKVEAINPPGFQGQLTSPETNQAAGQPAAAAGSTNVQPAVQPTSPVGSATAQATNQLANQPGNQPTGQTAPIDGSANAQQNGQPQSPVGAANAQATNQLTNQPTIQAPAQPTNLGITVEDVAVPSTATPAVFALASQADASQKRGDLEGAVVITERALRIDSRNPVITYKLALLRLKQNKPQLAEDLAGKAALLAGSDLEMKRKSWLLIAEARQNQQNVQGAKEAKNKAESFFGR